MGHQILESHQLAVRQDKSHHIFTLKKLIERVCGAWDLTRAASSAFENHECTGIYKLETKEARLRAPESPAEINSLLNICTISRRESKEKVV